ncbi:uroporphyrinogen-III synthase [Metabacillus litoralis]|uniref:uroporphyrinogen-III synthase n=1 Tax=Metabacillus litoralis TaxID=152268 RepID=UPI001CFD2E04|nr:uroporphyrinogen-III synthase [Metabacillus litoralis]
MKSVDPLQGKRVLITRAKSQVEGFIKKIEESGGVAISAPLLQIEANDENEVDISQTLDNIKDYDCIVFTSANGVTFFKGYLDKFDMSYDQLSHLTAASVGRKTSEQMKKIGLSVSIVPEEFVAEKLAESLSTNLPNSSNILVIRGNLARPTLVSELTRKGFKVTDLVVYKTLHNETEAHKLQHFLSNDELDYITFTSSSTVDSFMKVLNQEELLTHLKKLTFICIGPITNETLKGYGFKGYMPDSYTTDDMVKLMIQLEDK